MEEEKKLLSAISNDNIEEIKSILKYSNENKKILNLNNIKDEHGQYPLLVAIKYSSNIELIELLIEYAEQHHLTLELNEKDNGKGDYPLLSAISNNNNNNNNIEIIKLLIEYSNRHQLILNLNEKNKWGDYPLLSAISNNNIEIVKLLTEYAIEHQIILEYNKKNYINYIEKSEIFELLENYEKEKELRKLEKEKLEWEKGAIERLKSEQRMKERLEKERLEKELLENIRNNNFEKVEAILNKSSNIILDINKKDSDGNSFLYYATKNDNANIIKLFIEYAEHHNVIIKINDRNNEGIYSFLNATSKNNVNMAKLLLDYSNENEIIININKQSLHNNYPLDNAICHNNIEMIKLLIEYADHNNIILDINQKDENENYLLDLIIMYDNIEIFNILTNYAENRNITLNLNEEKIKEYIPKLNNNILIGLKNYYQKGKINIEFKENSELNKILVDKNEYLIKDNNNYLEENENEETITRLNIENYLNHINLYNNKNLILSFYENILKMKEYKFSFLILACYFDDEKWVKRLINNNADINIKNIDGDTPLTIACYFNNINIVKLLIDNGADVNVENNDNETPSTISVNNDEIHKIIEEKKKIDVNNKQRNETKKPINYYQSNKEEMYTKYSGNPMDFEKLKIIGNISVFKIKYENDNEIKTGTGFFVKLPMPSNEEPMYGLMTCNHVFSESVLKLNFKFKIYLNNEGKKIKLNESYFNGTNFIFTSPLIDITFIQLSDDLIAELGLDKDEHFLIPCMNYENIFNESVHAFQYPKDENCKCDEKVKSLVGFDFFHNVSTDDGSSGSPLINNNFEIIGVHKSKNEVVKLNIATDFRIIQYAILKLYNNKYIIDIDKSRLSPKKLTPEEIDELKKHGLQQKSKYVFTLPKLDNSPELNFYRSNHGWYWTKEIFNSTEYKKYDINKKYDIGNLKKHKWHILKFIREKEDNYPEYKEISHRQKVTITFLKLSEFKYLNHINNY
eukprot:jgi/Orpsp1_1/1178316/evm.model.c7180000064811.1